MTSIQKLFYTHLLNGCYMVQSVSHSGKETYRIKTADHSPVMYVFKLDKVLKTVLKKDKHGHYTLNRSLVRQLNGKHSIKQLYKKQLNGKEKRLHNVG